MATCDTMPIRATILDLALEIRREIYRVLLLSASSKVIRVPGRSRGYNGDFNTEISTELLRVNHQFYLEALPVLYENTLHITQTCGHELHELCDLKNIHRFPLVRCISGYSHVDMGHRIYNDLTGLPNIEKIVAALTVPSKGSYALKNFEWGGIITFEFAYYGAPRRFEHSERERMLEESHRHLFQPLEGIRNVKFLGCKVYAPEMEDLEEEHERIVALNTGTLDEKLLSKNALYGKDTDDGICLISSNDSCHTNI